MRRLAAIILLSMVLPACSSSFVDDTKQATQAKFQQLVASQFAKRLERGIDLVVDNLTKEGGYLDDPLIRILLPPPLGLALGIVRGLQTNPEATLLEMLMNQAAEKTIPLAGPILKNIVTNMTTPSLEKLLSAGKSSATDYLKEQSEVALQTILLPAITEQLHANGAIELYSKLLKAKEITDQIPTILPDENQQIDTPLHQVETIASIKPEQLGQYVMEQAMSGLFKKVAEKELSIRKNGDIDLFNKK